MFPKALLVFGAVVLARVVNGNYDVSEKLLFPLLPNGAPRSTNNVCREESQLYISHLNNLTLWAHKMWDASAKSSIGVLQGNVYQMGDWDECMKVNGPFQTQFCLATLTAKVPKPDPPRDPFSLRYHPMENVLRRIYKNEDQSQISRDVNHFGWCVPASCSHLDLEQSLTTYFDKLEHPLKSSNVSYSIKVPQNFCQSEKDINNFGVEDIIFCLLVALLFVMCVVATACDYSGEEKERKLKLAVNDRGRGKENGLGKEIGRGREIGKERSETKENPRSLSTRICLAFSLKGNFASLPRADDSNPALSILYGLRTFSIFMIIMDHRFGTYITGPIMNYDFIEGEYRSVATWFIFHGDLFVDTFFVLSGILVTYGLLSQFDKKVMHPGYIVLLRYIRLTPLYAFVVFYYASMFNHSGFGPIWKVVVPPESADCKKNWWANLLYISNYVNDKHMCMAHSWYLPCDFHYFIIGIFVCLLIRKNKKYGLAAVGLLFAVSVAIPFVITIAYLRPALLYFYPEFLLSPKTHPDFVLTYTKSHTRASSYFIGMAAGYVYYRLKDREFGLSKLTSHIITFGSILFLFAGMASGAIFYNPYHEYNPYEAAAYAAFHRPAWALGTVGLLFAASYGHATFLNVALSWSPWIPLSKLVYGAYLIHMSFQIRYVGASMSPRFFDYFDIICLALGDIVLSFSAALVMYLGIEAPLRKIFRELLSPPKRDPKPAEPANGEISFSGTCISISRL